jgi:hypothetical protein
LGATTLLSSDPGEVLCTVAAAALEHAASMQTAAPATVLRHAVSPACRAGTRAASFKSLNIATPGTRMRKVLQRRHAVRAGIGEHCVQIRGPENLSCG